MGGVVARGAQQYSYTAGGHGQGVTCGSGTSGGGGREGAFAAARLLQLRCAGGMLSRVYSPQVPWSYLMSMFVEGKHQLRANSS